MCECLTTDATERYKYLTVSGTVLGAESIRNITQSKCSRGGLHPPEQNSGLGENKPKFACHAAHQLIIDEILIRFYNLPVHLSM